jgi:RNA-directed DNA polymerase
MMNEYGKSDRPIVPKKVANKTAEKVVAESEEGRGLTKGNPSQQNTPRIQGRISVPSAMERVREAAKKDKETRFTALLHHVYEPEMLRQSYWKLKKEAAAGVDGETWQHYGERLEENLQDLSHRLQRGAYRAKPVRRVQIPKMDGGKRPLGITVLEDKIVQRATVEVLNAIYEIDFAEFSYGFRPGRSQHDALDQLYLGLTRKKVNWVIEVDIRAYFDRISWSWLIKFIEHRIADRRLVRLIQKWMKAGVLEKGKRIEVKEGTPQGGSVSPLLGNVYLHYVFDLWAQQWCRGIESDAVMIVRYADDIVLGFKKKTTAERFLKELKERMEKFELELHPDKTRLLEFGRFASQDRQQRGEGAPETFNFLGFTHICGKTKEGKYTVLRQTIRKRMQAKLKAVGQELKRRRHEPLAKVGKWLGSIVRGHSAYYGVPMNGHAVGAFRFLLVRLWRQRLNQRSQTGAVKWERMRRLSNRWIPPARIQQPYPTRRSTVFNLR